MAADTLLEIEPIMVMYAAGEKGEPIARQAPAAFERLEAKLDTLKRKKFYGVILGEEYRACVALDPEGADAAAPLPFPVWTIPGGRYIRRKILNWEEHIDQIAKTFDELCLRPDYDPSRPRIEYYRSQKELFLLVPVQ